PMWQIPINKNAPYTPEKIRPAIPYESEENVTNPCKVDDLNKGGTDSGTSNAVTKAKVVIFHNNTGPMCLEALDFLRENNIEHEQHLTTDSDYSVQLEAYKADNPTSEGVSTNYGYYPLIFVNGSAFSGFNNEIGEDIIE